MTSFLGELQAGRLRWDLVHPFPVPDPADRAAGEASRRDLARLLAEQVDADRVDATRTLPDGLPAALAAGGFLALTAPRDRGGRGLSRLAVFRLLEAAAAHSTAVGMFLAWHNVLGVAAYRELLPPGPLQELVDAGLAAGAVFGLGDSERGGAARTSRATVAEPTAGGYLLTGEKLFVGNGSSADLLTVTATVRDGAGERVDLFLVDTDSDGFTVVGVQELLGLAGSPIAAVRLDRVFVPAHRVLATAAGGWRTSPAVQRLNAFARLAITGTQTLGPARACLGWVRDFLDRRPDMNGRPLAEYEAVQRRLAGMLADVYATDSVVEWTLLAGLDQERLPEFTAAKNIVTMTSWRVIDEAVSLLGGEGVEGAASKARRGVPPLPVERALRDARCLRVAGGVDFNIDQRCGWSGIFAPRYAGGSGSDTSPVPEGAGRVAPGNPGQAVRGPGQARSGDPGQARSGDPGQAASGDPGQAASGGPGQAGSPGQAAPGGPGQVGSDPPAALSAALSGRSRRHLGFVAAEVAALRSRCDELARRYPAAELAERQEVHIAANRIADELYTMAVVLARTAGLATEPAQQLADVFCTGARTRVAHHWRGFDSLDGADHAGLCRSWLSHSPELATLLGPEIGRPAGSSE